MKSLHCRPTVGTLAVASDPACYAAVDPGGDHAHQPDLVYALNEQSLGPQSVTSRGKLWRHRGMWVSTLDANAGCRGGRGVVKLVRFKALTECYAVRVFLRDYAATGLPIV